MISYKPLLKTLIDKNKKLTDLAEIISFRTIAKIRKKESMSLDTIDKIAKFLDVEYHDIVERSKE